MFKLTLHYFQKISDRLNMHVEYFHKEMLYIVL